MTNDEVKILSNMAIVLSKIEIKNTYTEEDYFNIFQLIDGYRNIEKYFHNNQIINSLLSKKIQDDELYDLIRVVRNRYSHVDKHDKLDKLVILQTKVDKRDIHTIINEIKKEMDNIFVRDLDSNVHKLIMNTKIIMNTFELMKSILNDSESKNDFDKYSKEILRPIINGFKYDESTEEEYNKVNDEIINIYKSNEIKEGLIKLYGEDNYYKLMQMMIDDTFTPEEAIELMNNIKKMSNISN